MAESRNYKVACGYQTCDIRNEYCNTGMVTPECVRCSGMCSHYRIVNDPVATERCQSLCPEYWRRIQTESSIEATSQTLVVASRRITNNECLLIVLIVLVIAILLFMVGKCIFQYRTRRRQRFYGKIGCLPSDLVSREKNRISTREDPEDSVTDPRSSLNENPTSNNNIRQPEQDDSTNRVVFAPGCDNTPFLKCNSINNSYSAPPPVISRPSDDNDDNQEYSTGRAYVQA